MTKLLVDELTWELRTARPSEGGGYVLSRLRWHAKEIGQTLAHEVSSKIVEIEEPDPKSLAEAMTVALSIEPRPPDPFTEIIAGRAKSDKSDERRAIYLAAFLCLRAAPAIEAIEAWVEGAGAKERSEERLTRILELVWSNRFDSFESPHKDYLRPVVLLRLLKLVHTYVRVEEDNTQGGVVTSRHNAQSARNQLLDLLYAIPGPETYGALVALSEFHTDKFRKDRMLVLADRRAELDAEGPPWEEAQIRNFAIEAGRSPTSEAELFRLALSRLDDIKLDLEDGDESDATLLSRAKDEPELRRAIAGRLRQTSEFRYTTGSEEELANKSRTDIRLHHPDVKERVPIELKIAGKWRAGQLRERLENQLGHDYLRAARHGVFLVVNRDAKRDKKSWKVGSQKLNFDGLLSWLKDEAQKLLSRQSAIEAIEIVGIDLTIRSKPQVGPKRKKTETKAKSKTVAKPRGKKKS